jgi:hypothetical protein
MIVCKRGGTVVMRRRFDVSIGRATLSFDFIISSWYFRYIFVIRYLYRI